MGVFGLGFDVVVLVAPGPELQAPTRASAERQKTNKALLM
jgi:hypothetical protein